MKKVLNKNKLFYFIITVLLFICFVIVGIKAYKEFWGNKEPKTTKPKELDSISLYGYTLDELDSSLYKEYFNELKSILNEEEVNFEDYAKSVVKLFVTDFYTLSTKITSSDIGGVEFIYPDFVDNFKMNAGDTIYNHVKNNAYGDRVQDLPTVKSVTIGNVISTTYTYAEEEYNAYRVDATWDYEVDLGFENSGEFYLIKHDSKLYIVEKTGE